MKISISFFVCVVSLMSAGVHAGFVTVANPGNDADTTTYGRVGYEYRISEYEVTAGEYVTFLNAVDPTGTNTNKLYNVKMDTIVYGCQISWNAVATTYDFSGGATEDPGSTAADWQNRPVNYVSWYDAARYTNWLTTGGTETGAYTLTGLTTVSEVMNHQAAALAYGTAYFIPTEDEWYKAAYYNASTGAYYDYPTGSDTAPTAETPIGGANSANFRDGDSNWVLGSPYYRTEVGAYSGSSSPYGTFDQGGNVWEFNEALVGTDRVYRGGSFSSANTANTLKASSRSDFNPGVDDPYIGFRVASNEAELASLTPNNSSPLSDGDSLEISNAAASAGRVRVPGIIASVDAPDGWSVATLTTGTTVDSSASVSGALSFDATGLLNGTYEGTITLGMRNHYTVAADTDAGSLVWDVGTTVLDNAGSGQSNLAAWTDLGSYDVKFTMKSISGDTTAELLDGTLSDDCTVSMDFTSFGGSAAGAISEVLTITGLGGERFALQMNYDPAGGTPDYLSWWNGSGWVNAVLGNSDGGGGASFTAGAYDGNLTLSRYGVDVANNVVWAVIDHNSEFAIFPSGSSIPEPASAVLLGLAGLFFPRRRG
ncbi:MAG: SUMF1/EgtB/PvdO family nonheme iron enzyme [Lentisphaeria bacterium]|nr:SUMF1/EgtB/PvdO family nonheme iron enzyme [Lentisphaeria bacterium]